MENKWDINYIQTLPAQIQQEVLRKISKVFMTKKSTERKTLHAIKIDLFELPDNKNSFQNMSFFPWIKLISVLFHLKYWHYNTPSLHFPCLPRHLCQMPHWLTETPFQRNLHHDLHRFLYFFLPHSTAHHIPNHTPSQANQVYYQTIYKS